MYRLYTDASAIQSRLAWAFVLKSEELTVEAAGRGSRGINQSETIAVLQGLDRITDPAEVVVFTDSVYAILAGKGRFRGVLQERLNAHRARHKIRFVKVGKGRGPCPDHQRAHHLAREECRA
jgi:ribonuclease HI